MLGNSATATAQAYAATATAQAYEATLAAQATAAAAATLTAAAVPAQEVINLADYAAGADWESALLLPDGHNGTDVEVLPWMGDEADSRGFVRLDAVYMEDGSIQNALRMHPKWVDNGTIKGWLRNLWITIPARGVFEAYIGFVGGAENTDGATFWLWEHHVENGYEVWNPLIEVRKPYDGTLWYVSADLSHLAGQDVYFEIRVDAGVTSGQDWAAWVEPRITLTY
jgi:hypothetical protein